MADKLMMEVEQGTILADLLLASTPRTLLRRLSENSMLQDARRSLTNTEIKAYVRRARELFALEVPEGYANSSDLPIAAYLYLTATGAHPQSVALLRELDASVRMDVGAAKGVARYLLEQIPENNVNGRSLLDPPPLGDWSGEKETDKATTNRLPEEQAACLFPREYAVRYN